LCLRPSSRLPLSATGRFITFPRRGGTPDVLSLTSPLEFGRRFCQVDFSSYIRELHNIYDLYTLDGNGAAGPGELVRADGRPYDWGSESAEGKMGSLRIRSDGPSDVTVDFTFNKDGTIRLL
jgi:hypothetical protein